MCLRLKKYLSKKRILKKDFAESVGVPYTSLWRWLTGKAAPSRQYALRIQEITDGYVIPQDFGYQVTEEIHLTRKPRAMNDL